MRDPYYYRNEYGKHKLDDTNLPFNPTELFESWLTEAFDADLPEPTAMTLATSNMEGRISSRIVLLKGFDSGGFQFYTSYFSQKGEDLEGNKFAALSFFWPEIERQVRIEGKVEKISSRESDLYHSARPRNNQLGAWASEQSKPVSSRETLESQYLAVTAAYEKHEVIPRPPKWGGYRLSHDRLEFWQGRENRLHDRINYIKDRGGSWSNHRLSP